MRWFFIFLLRCLLFAVATLSPEWMGLWDGNIDPAKGMWQGSPWLRQFWLFFPVAMMEGFYWFLHEAGHTVFQWLYAMPSIPSYKETIDNGLGWPILRRTATLQIIIYGGMLWACRYLFLEGFYGRCAALAAFIVVHLCFTWGGRHEWVILSMGNAGASLCACYLLWRAAHGYAFIRYTSLGEKYVNMTVAIYALMKVLLLSWSAGWGGLEGRIFKSVMHRHPYDDILALSQRTGVSVQAWGVAFFWFTLGVFAATLAAIIWRKYNPPAASVDFDFTEQPPERRQWQPGIKPGQKD
jgi:hypothetical protein